MVGCWHQTIKIYNRQNNVQLYVHLSDTACLKRRNVQAYVSVVSTTPMHSCSKDHVIDSDRLQAMGYMLHLWLLGAKIGQFFRIYDKEYRMIRYAYSTEWMRVSNLTKVQPCYKPKRLMTLPAAPTLNSRWTWQLELRCALARDTFMCTSLCEGITFLTSFST